MSINLLLGTGDEELRTLLGGFSGEEKSGGRFVGGGGIAAVARAAINISNTGSTSGGQGGGSGGSGGGGGGAGSCVAAAAWLDAKRQAANIEAGAEIDVLAHGQPLRSERAAVERVQWAFVSAVTIISASGIALTCSNDTPVEQPDGSVIFAPHLMKKGGSAVVEDGAGLRWEPIVSVTVLRRKIKVARIHIGGRTYAAGDQPHRRIYTHNPIK